MYYGVTAVGWDGKRSIIGKIEKSMTGNTILEVGSQDIQSGQWEKTEDVVLNPSEVKDLVTDLVGSQIVDALMAATEHGKAIREVHQNQAFHAGIIEAADRLGVLSDYAQAVKAAR